MALIYCPECKKEISVKVKTCPQCGYKILKFDSSTKLLFVIIALLIVITSTIVGVSYYKSSQERSRLEATTTIETEQTVKTTEDLPTRIENDKISIQQVDAVSPDVVDVFGFALSIFGRAISRSWSIDEVFKYLYLVDMKNDEWKSFSEAPVGMHAGGFVLCNDALYSIGGSRSNGYSGLNFQYNPTTNQWTKKASMHIKRMNVAVVSTENKIYAIGGDPFLAINEVYDPIKDEWSSLKPMPTGSQHVKGVVVNGKIYVMGGLEDWNTVSNKNQVYDITTDSWLEMAPMPIGKHNYSSIVYDDKVYVFGGGVYDTEANGIWGSNSTIEVYDTKTDTWESIGRMPTSLFYGGIVAYGDEVIILGGFRDSDEPETRVDIFSLNAHTWSKGVPLPKASVAMGVVEYNDQLYISGGTDSSKNWLNNRQLYQIPIESMFTYLD